ncbi:MAG: GspH/FimT family pseudopilin [Rhodanobacteraceae bacterium]
MSSNFITRLRARCRACGFTLVELMITLAVAAILAMIAVPSFKHLLISTNLSNLSNELSGDLQYARTQAVSRQVNVAVAASGGSWQNGWYVEVVPAGTAPAERLRAHPLVADRYAIAAAGATSVAYQPQGSLSSPTGGACFTMSAPDEPTDMTRYVQVLSPGMLQPGSGSSAPTSPDCTAP